MANRPYIAARVDPDTKARFTAAAQRRGVSESTLLKRLIEATLMTAEPADSSLLSVVKREPLHGKISIRLRSDDLQLLRERAQTRQMPTSTFVSFLIRAHLRRLTPLPTVELMAFKRSVAEVGAVGRNLNQIAHAFNRGDQPTGPSKDELRALLQALYALREHTKALIRANLQSWEVGDA